RSASTRCRRRSTGSALTAPFPAPSASPGSPSSPWSRRGWSARARSRWSAAPTSPSRALSAADFAAAGRSHWEIETPLHWILDVTFKEDLSRLRAGHGAANMAVVRHFALNLVRQAKDKRAIKRRRKMAAWDPAYLTEILGATAH